MDKFRLKTKMTKFMTGLYLSIINERHFLYLRHKELLKSKLVVLSQRKIIPIEMREGKNQFPVELFRENSVPSLTYMARVRSITSVQGITCSSHALILGI